MSNCTPGRKTRNQTQNGLNTPPSSPTATKGDLLRSQLQNLLDELPQDLPTYYHEELLDDLCFLLRSPLFLYSVSPRIRRGKRKLGSSTKSVVMTAQARVRKSTSNGTVFEPQTELDVASFRMEIKREEDSWVTRLLYNNAMLVEGREYCATEDAQFVTSFCFFCEEVRFLSCEFRAREHAATVPCGSAIDEETQETGLESAQEKNERKKRRRLVKLKINPRLARSRPMCIGRMGR